MAPFNIIKPEKPHRFLLPRPDDSVSFFETIKVESEKYWQDIVPNKTIYGYQIQRDSTWRPGLTDIELQLFENALGIVFPSPLRNFYKVMNGLTKPGINFNADTDSPPSYRPVFYSYPDDLSVMQDLAEWIYDATSFNKEDFQTKGVSRIFPVFQHRFMMVDLPGCPILSMFGDDIIYWADNLSKLLAKDIFDNISNASDFESLHDKRPVVKFWLD